MIREEIAAKAKKIKAAKEENNAKKKTTDTGEKPEQVIVDPEINSLTGQVR